MNPIISAWREYAKERGWRAYADVAFTALCSYACIWALMALAKILEPL